MEKIVRAGVRIEVSWKSRLIVVVALLGESSLIRRWSVPVAEGEVVFAGQAHAEKNDSRGRNGCLLNRAGGGRLDYVRRGVTNRAVRMRQPIRMKVCLLNADADDKKDGADDGKQKVSAHIGRPILPHV
jgi:hypothetical protein